MHCDFNVKLFLIPGRTIHEEPCIKVFDLSENDKNLKYILYNS